MFLFVPFLIGSFVMGPPVTRSFSDGLLGNGTFEYYVMVLFDRLLCGFCYGCYMVGPF